MRPFRLFANSVQVHLINCSSGEDVLAGLLDALVDRIADVLERVQRELDHYSTQVFSTNRRMSNTDFDRVLRRVGHNHKLTANARESLVSLTRVVSFLGRPEEDILPKNQTRRFKTIAIDLNALADHSSFLSGNIQFMLDATMGMINNEQNNVMKILSVAATVFLPPTLIGSIYGMNFKYMPELDWPFGYPISIGLMVATAVLPYLYFKRRGWL